VFLESSRYFKLKTVEVRLPSEETGDQGGRTSSAVTLRRLPYVSGTPTVIKGNDRLDVIAQRKYSNPTMFWHVADANTELEANNLLKEKPGAEEVIIINVPEK
jgi:hypothetical protein